MDLIATTTSNPKTRSLVFRTAWLWAPALAAVVACASNQNPPAESPAPAAPSASAAPEAAPAPSASEGAAAAPAAPGAINWEAMSKEERGKYMKQVVMPKMKEVFVAFDASKYGAMNCVTCHGKGAANGSFDMPNPELPKLPHDMSKFKEWAAKKPQMTEFMVKHVKPEMAKLLNLPEFDPATKQGFGCGACHAMEGS